MTFWASAADALLPDLKAFGIDAPTLSVGGRPRKAKTALPAAPAQPAEPAGTVPAALA